MKSSSSLVREPATSRPAQAVAIRQPPDHGGATALLSVQNPRGDSHSGSDSSRAVLALPETLRGIGFGSPLVPSAT